MAIGIEDLEGKRGGKGWKNLLLLGLSLLIGAGGVYLARNFIKEKVDYYRSQLDKHEAMVKMVVPVRDMRRGETVRSVDLALREIPLSYAHKGAVGSDNYEIAVGQRLSFDIAAGRPLLWAHLEGGLSPTFSGAVTKGKRAITVPVDEINSISGFLAPGDNIDLYMTYRQAVVPVIQSLHVLATGSRTVRDKTGRSTSTYQTITVEVAPKVAKKIMLARSVGEITAALRNPKDRRPSGLSAYTLADLLNKPRQARKKKRRVVPKARIEYIIGGS